MRPGQSNKRSRGRGRKGPSPLSRSYESNGPDVKIRGTAQHIADKYINLARDAQSSGDTVLSEAYLQHAEHFYRIVAAAQQQMNQPVNVKRADDPIETEESDEREGGDPSDPDAPQPEMQGEGFNGGRRNNREDDGDGRSRRNRGRQRRGRGEDYRGDETRGEPRGEGDEAPKANGAEASDGAEGEERPRRAPRQRKAAVDVSDRHDEGMNGDGGSSSQGDDVTAEPSEPPKPVSLGDDVAPLQAAAEEG